MSLKSSKSMMLRERTTQRRMDRLKKMRSRSRYVTYQVESNKSKSITQSEQNPCIVTASEHNEANVTKVENAVLENNGTKSKKRGTSRTICKSKSNSTIIRFDGVIRNNPIKRKKQK